MTYSGQDPNTEDQQVGQVDAIDLEDYNYVDDPSNNEYTFVEPDIYSYKDAQNVQLRSIPFGPPKTRDNETHNPGRQIWGPKNATNSYGKREGRQFLFTEDGKTYGKSSTWQSGPSDNSKATDYVVTNAGYWTAPAGTNAWYANKASSPELMTAFDVKNRQDGKFLFDLAHSTATSGEGETAEYGVCGLSGYFLPDYDEAVY